MGTPGVGRFLAIGLYAFAARPKGTLTVIYSRPASARPAPVPAPAADVTDQIRRLGELHSAGILTTEQFEATKAELLARM